MNSHEEFINIKSLRHLPVLEVQYFPPIELSPDKNYVLDLVELSTFNSIPNIDTGNNKFYVGKEQLFLPTGSYEIEDIANFLRETLALEYFI